MLSLSATDPTITRKGKDAGQRVSRLDVQTEAKRMTNKKVHGGARVFLFTAVLMMGAFTLTSAAQTCESPDSKIVSDIYERIRNDKGLSPQTPHINVVSLYGAVKLQGWTDTQKDYDRLMDMVFGTSCVRLVNTHELSATPPPPESPIRMGRGCSTGTKACGDLCIPEGDSCNIGAVN